MRKIIVTLFLTMIAFTSFNAVAFAFSGQDIESINPAKYEQARLALDHYTNAIVQKSIGYHSLKYLDIDTLILDELAGGELLDLLKKIKKENPGLEEEYYLFYIDTLCSLPMFVKELERIKAKDNAKLELAYADFEHNMINAEDLAEAKALYSEMMINDMRIITRFNKEHKTLNKLARAKKSSKFEGDDF